jgi:hypothetical protein
MAVEQRRHLSLHEFLRFTTQLGMREKKRADVIRRGFSLVKFLPGKARTKAVTRFIYEACPQDEHWPVFLREGFGNFPAGVVTELLTSAFDEEAKWLTLVNQAALGYFREARNSVGAFLAVAASLGQSQLNQRWVPVVPELLKRCEPAWFMGSILKRKPQLVALNQDIQRLFGQAIAGIAFDPELASCLSEGRSLGLPGECTDILDIRGRVLTQLNLVAQGKALTAIDLEPRKLLIEQPAAIGF